MTVNSFGNLTSGARINFSPSDIIQDRMWPVNNSNKKKQNRYYRLQVEHHQQPGGPA